VTESVRVKIYSVLKQRDMLGTQEGQGAAPLCSCRWVVNVMPCYFFAHGMCAW